MKVTLNWLKQYVDFDGSSEELADRLTMLGLEVEGMEPVGGGFEGIVVAEVISRGKHPNADRLSLCRVHDGQEERQVVCGAHNFEAGDKVALILPGASLPLKEGEAKPFTIKVGRIRGLESHGMICSHQELGVEPETLGLKRVDDGILVLRQDARPGQCFAEYLGRADRDVVYDLETTPNRPDWNSVIGIAREIAAATGNALKLPTPTLDTPRNAPHATSLVSIRLEAPDLCPRYTARVIQGVKIGPSPQWLRTRLEHIGIRSINNVVDVTNFVMMESGQPLHAFDYHLIAKDASGVPTIIIRRAAQGELFTTLDEQEHTLTPEHLLIADSRKGIALAGVMGGQNTEIHDQTVDVLIESAYFAPTNIRRTSKALGLRTDSSYRFERGADPGICDWASRRAAQLILETAGGRLADGVADVFPEPPPVRHLTLRPHKVTDLLGIPLKREEIAYYLGQFGLKTDSEARRPVAVEQETSPDPLRFEIPSFRVDLKCEVDLIEEVCRLHGVDRIPSTPPRGAHGTHPFDAVYDAIAEARRILTALGLSEAQGQTLISRSECGMQEMEVVALANPLSADMDVMRPSLLPGLIHALRHNVARKQSDVALFEIGRVFRKASDASTACCEEPRQLALALTGRRRAGFWSGPDREARVDAFDVKGLMEEFLDQYGVRGVTYTARPEPTDLFLESAAITLGGKLRLGQTGLLQPALARQYDLRDPVFAAELDLDLLLARRNPAKSFRPLPQFPAIRRDVAMLVAEAITHEQVLTVTRRVKPAHLEVVELFDVFRGKHVPEGQKSVAYAFTYRSTERTLTDQEVGDEHAKVVKAFKRELQATVRE
jgi:phenylalanyl-tRNA synthetase beta chain